LENDNNVLPDFLDPTSHLTSDTSSEANFKFTASLHAQESSMPSKKKKEVGLTTSKDTFWRIVPGIPNS
jgi:hypothetical protein